MKNLFKIGVLAIGMMLTANAANAQQKFGHINSADLLQAMPEMKSADASFQTYAKAKQTSLELMGAERQKLVTTYEEKYNNSNLCMHYYFTKNYTIYLIFSID